MNNFGDTGLYFTVPVSAGSLTTGSAYDLLTITAASGSRLELRKINFQIASTQYTTLPAIGVTIYRGSTGVSTGAAITPQNVKGWSGANAAPFTATSPCSNTISTTSAVLVWAGAFDAHGSLDYCPDHGEVQHLTKSQNLLLRTTTPSVAVTVYGTATLRDTGPGLPT